MKVKLLSHVQLLAIPRTAAHQAPPSMGFSRQEYWSGVPLPSLMTNLESLLKSTDITWPTKVCLVKAMVFPVVVYGCRSWTIKKVEHWMVLAKTLENPLDCKEIQPVSPKGNQSWIFIGRTSAEAEAPILWPPDAKSSLIGKDPEKDWRQGEKGMTGDKMVGWHHWFNEHEFEQILGDSEGLGGLACCSPWGHKELDRT